jgi:chromosome segregation ATPase
MLEKKDLEMIAEVVSETVKEVNKPIYERLDNVDARLDKMESRLDRVERKVTDIQMTLENETNKNIQIIAEGHLDLSRKLDDALKVENEKEMLLIRVNRLENEVRRLKDKIEGIA